MEIYDVSLHTPLGKRKGELKAKIENGKLKGFLSLFGHTEPIEGVVGENGECLLSGRFVTLMNSVDFTASGNIYCGTLNLILKKGRDYYKMLGSIRGKEGE